MLAMTTEELPDDVRDRVLIGAGCWLWTGPSAIRYSLAGPYRRAVLRRRLPDGRWQTTTTARAVLAHHLGRPLEAGELALHTCDEPLCVRPSHLYAGSALENTDDARRRGRLRPGGRRPQVRPQPVDGDTPSAPIAAPPTR